MARHGTTLIMRGRIDIGLAVDLRRPLGSIINIDTSIFSLLCSLTIVEFKNSYKQLSSHTLEVLCFF
jgi:hypothetical protein